MDNFDDVLMKLLEEEKKIKEYKKTVRCPICKRLLYYKPQSQLKLEGNLEYHVRCFFQFKNWEKDWIQIWAEIGWHARIDILTKSLETKWALNEITRLSQECGSYD